MWINLHYLNFQLLDNFSTVVILFYYLVDRGQSYEWHLWCARLLANKLVRKAKNSQINVLCIVPNSIERQNIIGVEPIF